MIKAKQTTYKKNRDELQKYWQQQKDNFVGYVWMSDSYLQKEHILENPCNLPAWEQLHNKTNFIWEVNLYAEGNKSIAIRQVNDYWLVSEVIWNEGEDIEHVEPFYHYGKGFSKRLLFKEAWLPEASEACEGMETLVPAWLAFCGFASKGE